MGLAAPKRRSKLSHDPNNTQWTKASDSFGQKIMSAQGWKPGDYLGASNASHSDHYTAANASHIRILLREENLGLGAQIGKGNAETFGLSLYSGVLSRLNGKSDVEVQKQQDALRDAELRHYQAQKFGSLQFVSGGFLVGDTIIPLGQQSDDSHAPTKVAEKRKRDPRSKEARREEKRLKRFANSTALDDTDGETPVKQPKGLQNEDAKKDGRKKDSTKDSISLTPKSSIERRHSTDSEPSKAHLSAVDTGANDNGLKTSKRSRKKDEKPFTPTGETVHELETASVTDRPRSKEERRARKEDRRRRKMEKTRAQGEQQKATIQSASPQKAADEVSAQPISAADAANRHAVRRRYIDQKRLASLDPQAMKEIFMLTAKG